MISIEEFLAGTRARSLCLAVAESVVEGVTERLWKIDSASPQGYALLEHLSLPETPVSALSDRLSTVSSAAIASWADPLEFFPALGMAVDSAMPWQPPALRDALPGLPLIRTALESTAAGILASPAVLWWSEDVDRSDQWAIQFVRDGRLEPVSSPGSASRRLADWRRFVTESEATFAEGASRDVPFTKVTHGAWWSMPLAHGDRQGLWARPPSSTRSVEALGAVGLALQEDGWGDSSAELRRIVPDADVRVYEVHRPSDWAHLVEQYPLDVSWSRRASWGESTGLDEPWFIPDYASVSDDFDAIHLSTMGYLTTAGDPVPVTGGGATVLAGWGPDETYWLTDRIVLADETTTWRRDSHFAHDWTLARS